MLTHKEIAHQYINYLQKGDLSNLLALFAKNAVVHSPIYGSMDAVEFYDKLSADTANSTLAIKQVFDGEFTGTFALYFEYQWTLKNNEHVQFDVVDIISLNDDMKITDLKIIYDTVKSRALVSQLKAT